MTRSLPAIADHRRLRFGVLFVLYLAQGVPYGLLLLALPAWLVSGGASAVQVGLYVSAASLPWTLKFMHGFFMDRYTYLPMGRRRPWLIGAQLVMVLGLLVTAALEPAATDVELLAAIGFAVMLSTTVQDVAVDGMAVDLLRDGERATANGLMFGAQSVGIAAGGAGSGWLIAQTGGAAAAMLAVAAFIGLAVAMIIVLRERTGERLLPWSAGEASATSLARQAGAWIEILRRTFRTLLHGRSLLALLGIVLAGSCWGFYLALAPLISASETGWDTARYSSMSGLGSLVSGIAAIAVFGLLIERFGTRAGLMVATGLMGAVSIAGALLADSWSNEAVMVGYIMALNCLYVMILVGFAALAMRLCDPTVSATQFGLYMAAGNLGASLAAAAFGPIMAVGGYAGVLWVSALVLFAGCAIFARVGNAPRPTTAMPERAIVD